MKRYIATDFNNFVEDQKRQLLLENREHHGVPEDDNRPYFSVRVAFDEMADQLDNAQPFPIHIVMVGENDTDVADEVCAFFSKPGVQYEPIIVLFGAKGTSYNDAIHREVMTVEQIKERTTSMLAKARAENAYTPVDLEAPIVEA